MKTLLLEIWNKHQDELQATFISGTSFGILMTEINLILKALVAGVTVIYFIYKIQEIRNNKKND